MLDAVDLAIPVMIAVDAYADQTRLTDARGILVSRIFPDAPQGEPT